MLVAAVVESGFCSGDLDPKLNDFCPNVKPAVLDDPKSNSELDSSDLVSVFLSASADESAFSSFVG